MRFFGNKSNPNAQTHVVAPAGGSKIPAYVALGSALRRRPTSAHTGQVLAAEQAPKRGMWVVYQQRTGILTNLEPGDVATVMLVDELGFNSIEMHVPANQLRQAWFEEIPKGRRPTYQEAVRFGYHVKPQ